MSGTRYDDVSVQTFATVDDLPAEALCIMRQAPGIFSSPTWWTVVLAHALPKQAKASFVTIWVGGRLVAVVPMLLAGGQLSGLTTPYTCQYTPLLATGIDSAVRDAAMFAFARFCRRSGLVRLDAIPLGWDGLAELETGVRQAGLRPIRFDHFGNWHEDVTGLDWDAYLQRRPGALRETIRRRSRRTASLPGARFDLFTRPEDMGAATAAFESVYQRSWKDAEPFPTFNTALMRAMAEDGLLRLGVWSIGTDAVAVAVQFWVVKDGQATVLKLAHDEAFKAHSPGTVLTALMLRHLLDQEHVSWIDFGRGDDAYKQGWAIARGQSIGLLLANPWRMSGALALLRQAVSRLRKGARPTK